MPKWSNRIPQPRLHKSSGQARIRFDGKDVYLGRWGSKEAKEAYASFVAKWTAARQDAEQARRDTPKELVTITVAVWRFWEWAEKRFRHPDGTPTREAESLRLALRPLRKLYGSEPVAEFGPSKLYDLQAELAKLKLARNTINSRIKKVCRFFRWCAGKEWISANRVDAMYMIEPLAFGQGGIETPGRRSPVAWEIVEATLPFLTPTLQALVKILWFTGARVSEIARLTTGMIDRSGDVWQAKLSRHKCAWRGQSRVILFGPQAQAILLPWLRLSEPDAPVFDPRRSTESGAKRRGPRAPRPQYGRHSLSHAIGRACDRAFPHPTLSGKRVDTLTTNERAELAEWRKSHRWQLAQLRHSRATQLREKFSLDVAAITLGHSKPSTTATVYSPEAIAHAIEAVRIAG